MEDPRYDMLNDLVALDHDEQQRLLSWIAANPDASIAPAHVYRGCNKHSSLATAKPWPRVKLGWTVCYETLRETVSPGGRVCGPDWYGGGKDGYVGIDAADVLTRAGIAVSGSANERIVVTHPNGTEYIFS